MGNIYNHRTLTANEILRLPSPVLICVDRLDIDATINDAGYQPVSLNLPLARSFLVMSEKDMQSVITDKIRNILPYSTPVYLLNYEMLFDPKYNLDIIRLFIDLSRRTRLIVKWCGTLDGDVLIYSEPGYEDYTRININNYDITVVV
jgi:hypothetical protein